MQIHKPPGGIFPSQTLPTPELNIARSGVNLLLSWIVPSLDFKKQQASDLATTNWADVTITPALNFSDLHYEVKAPLVGDNHFYRLSAIAP